MTRAVSPAAWVLWGIALALSSWGLADAPRRGDVGLLLRGDRVGAVAPGSPASRAGLAPGERVALAEGGGAATLRARLARLRPGETVALARRDLAHPPVTLRARPAGAETVAWRVAWGVVALGFLGIGALVARARPDTVGLLFLLWCSVTSLAVSPRPAWPGDAGALAHDLASSAAALFLPALLVHFFARFPEGRGRRRTVLARVLYAGAAGLAVLAPVAGGGGAGSAVAAAGALLFAAGVVGAMISFAVSYRNAGARHRRRLNVLLWASVLGLAPFAALTLWANLGPSPSGPPVQLAALLLLGIPAAFAYAIEVHQVFDFRWRTPGDRPVPGAAPTAPPVFAAGDTRATVDAVAGDLAARLGLAHCGAYVVNGGPDAGLVTWLGDLPESGAPERVGESLLAALARHRRPVGLEELSGDGNGAGSQIGPLARAGCRTLVPLFSSRRLRAVLSLGPGLSVDLAHPRLRAALAEYAEHASLAVEHADYHDERVQQARITHELELAREIQERLRPERDPVFPNLACAGATIPSGRVGGDYYDYVPLGERRFGVAVADVCGKGVPAALLVSHVQAALRLRAAGGAPPSVVLEGLNRDLVRFHQPEKFVCLLYAVVDARERTVTWANGGLNPPMTVRADGRVEPLPAGDLILGVDPETRYGTRRLGLDPGDTLVYFTDGIVDARRGDEDFGTEHLAETLTEAPCLRAPRLRDRLLDAARSFHHTGLPDDMTVVVLRGL